MENDFLKRAKELLSSGIFNGAVILAGNELISYLYDMGIQYGIFSDLSDDGSEVELNYKLWKLQAYGDEEHTQINMWLMFRKAVVDNQPIYSSDQMKTMVLDVCDFVKTKNVLQNRPK